MWFDVAVKERLKRHLDTLEMSQHAAKVNFGLDGAKHQMGMVIVGL